jgi:hypothetical protein
MENSATHLSQSSLVMKILGWSLLGLPALLVIYPPGFVWGEIPLGICLGPAHPPSPYDGLHPYLFMIIALYAALGILFIRGASDPKANVWGVRSAWDRFRHPEQPCSMRARWSA